MKTRLIWKDCNINGNKDSFFIECTDEDVVTKILPLVTVENFELIQTIPKLRKRSLINEEESEKDLCNYFLISRDCENIKCVPSFLPYSSQWNAYNPFIAFEPVEFDDLNVLAGLVV
jgi:hypothetical protein